METAHLSPRATTRRAHRLPIRVYYEDTDAAGVVYYANYLKFAERGRTEWLREIGFNQGLLRDERQLVFVVSKVEAHYLLGAELDEHLEVVTHIERLGRASVIFVQTVERGGVILFRATVTIACVNWQRRKAASIPPDIRAQMEAAQ